MIRLSRSPFRLGFRSIAAAVAALACASCSSGSPTTVGGHDSGAHDAATKDSGNTPDVQSTTQPDATREAASDAHVTTAADATTDGATDAKKTAPDAPFDAPVDSGPAVADAGGPSDAGKAPAPSGSATTSTTPINFALHHLWLGDSLPDSTFTTDTTGTIWQKFGYNIDGLITNQYSTDVCTLNKARGATQLTQVDGDNGIDNSFGANIVPLLSSALSNLSQSVSKSISDGSFTILVDTVGLTSSPTQTNTGLKGELFSGASYGGTPPITDAGAFVVTDNWPIGSNSLSMGTNLDAGSVVGFPTAYVSNGLWVNGSPADLTLLLLLQGQPLVLRIHEAVVTFNHTVDGSGQDHATNGIISGVLKTTEFLTEINEVAAAQQYCSEASLLLNFIGSASDIMHDGTNAAGKPCDGISIGLAFDGDAIAAPSKVIQVLDAGGMAATCVADAGG